MMKVHIPKHPELYTGETLLKYIHDNSVFKHEYPADAAVPTNSRMQNFWVSKPNEAAAINLVGVVSGTYYAQDVGLIDNSDDWVIVPLGITSNVGIAGEDRVITFAILNNESLAADNFLAACKLNTTDGVKVAEVLARAFTVANQGSLQYMTAICVRDMAYNADSNPFFSWTAYQLYQALNATSVMGVPYGSVTCGDTSGHTLWKYLTISSGTTGQVQGTDAERYYLDYFFPLHYDSTDDFYYFDVDKPVVWVSAAEEAAMIANVNTAVSQFNAADDSTNDRIYLRS